MSRIGWICPAIGVVLLSPAFAQWNQLEPLAMATAVGLSNEGIQFPDGTTQTTAAANARPRALYLTREAWNGSQAAGPGVCEEGFHFASIWEVLDVSNLRYDKSRGLFTPDAGGGPLVSWWGWIRTGADVDASTTPGEANCGTTLPWDSALPNDFGSAIYLPTAASVPWTAPPTRISPWVGMAFTCNSSLSVWCIED